MEDTLRGIPQKYTSTMQQVLILVLMEDTLRAGAKSVKNLKVKSLNPCFNGRYSQSATFYRDVKGCGSLNPCFNGRYSQRVNNLDNVETILSLNPCFNGRYSQRRSSYHPKEVDRVS